MRCYLHPEVETVGACTVCGRGICSECAVETQGRLVCRECLAKSSTPIATSPKDPNTVFLLELVGGIFGLLGLGHFYVGRTNDGILRLIVWWVWIALEVFVAIIVYTVLAATIVGIICIPFGLLIEAVIHIGIPYWSAATLKKQLVPGGGVTTL